MEQTDSGPRTPLLQMVTSLAIAFLTIGIGYGQSNVESVDELKGKYEGAYDLLLQPIHDLNKQYRKALERLLEKESSAGQLESSLQVKNELEAFGDGRAFNEEAFNAREYSLPGLLRIRTTYLTQRNTTWQNLEEPESALLKKYVATLNQFEKEQTRLQNFEAALAAKEESKRVMENRKSKPSNGEIFEGRIQFVVKGEIEIWHNGERQTFRDHSREEQYIAGETRPTRFKNGDLIQMKVTGTANFRSLIMFLSNEEKTKYLAFERADYRIGDKEHMDKEVEMEEIKTLTGSPDEGPVDSDMALIWDEMKDADAVRSKCQWTKIESQIDSNYYICILDETRLIEVP